MVKIYKNDTATIHKLIRLATGYKGQFGAGRFAKWVNKNDTKHSAQDYIAWAKKQIPLLNKYEAENKILRDATGYKGAFGKGHFRAWVSKHKPGFMKPDFRAWADAQMKTHHTAVKPAHHAVVTLAHHAPVQDHDGVLWAALASVALVALFK